MWKIIAIILLFLTLFALFCGREPSPIHKTLKKGSAYSTDVASLQRGAKYFMNYCSGCHSLQFMRYNRLGIDLNIIDKNNPATLERLKNNLIFTRTNPNDTIKSSLHKEDALSWFGKSPPDLSLSIRARSRDWVYNYLLSFYPDNARSFGVNNNVIKNTAMPDPLALLREHTSTTYRKISNINNQSSIKAINNLSYSYSNKNTENSKLEEVVIDLVNFLAYTAEPTKTYRQVLGIKVCGFLLLFSCLVYFLKKQIWKNIK